MSGTIFLTSLFALLICSLICAFVYNATYEMKMPMFNFIASLVAFVASGALFIYLQVVAFSHFDFRDLMMESQYEDLIRFDFDVSKVPEDKIKDVVERGYFVVRIEDYRPGGNQYQLNRFIVFAKGKNAKKASKATISSTYEEITKEH